MIHYPACEKSIDECASWPSFDAPHCLLEHRTFDCTGMDDIQDDLDALRKDGSPSKMQINTLAMRMERNILNKSKNSKASIKSV